MIIAVEAHLAGTHGSHGNNPITVRASVDPHARLAEARPGIHPAARSETDIAQDRALPSR
ncbi:MAG: hypothetical protein IPO95_16610 [Rhodanobacteraceae bacterium]|nr:hypothetical protein [Rhodanobacteraceae bacterium]